MIKKFFKGLLGFVKKHVKLLVVLVLLLAGFLYVRNNVKKAQEAFEEAANQVHTATVDQMDLQQSVSLTGTLKALDTATVTSSVGGAMTGVKVDKVNYEVGDYVEKGAIVVEFDGDDYNRKLAELDAQSNLSNKRTAKSIADLQESIVDMQKVIDEDQKYLDDYRNIYLDLKDAYDQYEKYDKYRDKEKYPTTRWDEQKAAAAAMQPSVTIEIYEGKEDEIEAYQQKIVDAQQEIELAQLQLNYDTTYSQVDAKDDIYESMSGSQVEAPFSGYIITMNVEEGNNYTTGSTVFTMADTSGFEVEATVDEYKIASIQDGQTAVVRFDATGSDEFKGTVSFVSLASEATISGGSANLAAAQTASSTATYKVKITMDDLDERFRMGMTAKASIVLDHADGVLAVPYDCVQENEDGTFFVTEVAEDGTETDIPITKGLESEYYVEIKGDGLKEGMTVKAIMEDGMSTNIMDYVTIE
ncbi:MAG: efflux RND transporter periplasmic adaptor subunit [Pseudobutyrivibrio sp.]|nr:efflux RND transporter periplasmic adaptor subunit [Pseudobutyrivibrio sp.]